MSRLRLSLLVAALLVACARDERPAYPAEIAQNFLRGCRANGGTEFGCQCALEETQRRLTIDEYRAMEGSVERGKPPPDVLVEIAGHCRQRELETARP